MRALEEQLRTANARYDLVVVGGSALEALGLVSRGTADVDVVALAEGETLIGADPLPQDLVAAVERVGRDFSLPATWLNPGPADLLQSGLPEGFLDRAVRRTYGPSLIVRYADRLDQIHLKLYAVVDRGAWTPPPRPDSTHPQ